MSSINLSSGIATSGTGIDVTSVVNQILANESVPEDQLKQNLTNLAFKQTTLRGFNSGLSALLTSLNALKDVTGAITARTAVSSRTDLLSATADSSAVAAQHTIVITNLATGSSYASHRYRGQHEQHSERSCLLHQRPEPWRDCERGHRCQRCATVVTQ